jgi:hypothetical protein
VNLGPQGCDLRLELFDSSVACDLGLCALQFRDSLILGHTSSAFIGEFALRLLSQCPLAIDESALSSDSLSNSGAIWLITFVGVTSSRSRRAITAATSRNIACLPSPSIRTVIATTFGSHRAGITLRGAVEVHRCVIVPTGLHSSVDRLV